MTTDTEQSLAEQHAAFKTNAARVIHEWAEPKGYCSEFDHILERVGLPGRVYHNSGRQHGGRWIWVPDGEDTEEAFQQWRRDTSVYLVNQAKRHGVTGYEDALAEAGFIPVIEQEVTICGEFTVKQTVSALEGVDLIGFVDAIAARDQVYYGFDLGDGQTTGRVNEGTTVTWKATVGDE